MRGKVARVRRGATAAAGVLPHASARGMGMRPGITDRAAAGGLAGGRSPVPRKHLAASRARRNAQPSAGGACTA